MPHVLSMKQLTDSYQDYFKRIESRKKSLCAIESVRLLTVVFSFFFFFFFFECDIVCASALLS